VIKEFFVKGGEKLINVLAVLSLVVVFLAGIGASSQTSSFGEGLLIFVVVEVAGIAYTIFIFFFVYLLLEIRDLLKEIAKNTSKESNVSEE